MADVVPSDRLYHFTTQAVVISFESAFLVITLLFLFAAPVLVTYKIVLGRRAIARLGLNEDPPD